jgi:hypothetical protein
MLYFPTTTTSIPAGTPMKPDGSGNVVAVGTSDTKFIGFTISPGTYIGDTTELVGIPGSEFTGALMDGAWTAGHYGIVSTGTAGKLTDSATIPATGSYVLLLNSGGGAGGADVLILKAMP